MTPDPREQDGIHSCHADCPCQASGGGKTDEERRPESPPVDPEKARIESTLRDAQERCEANPGGVFKRAAAPVDPQCPEAGFTCRRCGYFTHREWAMDQHKCSPSPAPVVGEDEEARGAAARREIPAMLNRMPFVKWDRLINNGNVSIYGWIPRPDGKHDFALVEWMGPDNWTFATSSATFDERIADALGIDSDNRFPCQRVVDVFKTVAWTTGSDDSLAPVVSGVTDDYQRGWTEAREAIQREMRDIGLHSSFKPLYKDGFRDGIESAFDAVGRADLGKDGE